MAGSGHGGALERFDTRGVHFPRRSSLRLVHADRFRNLRADAHHGIERRHRLLKNHGDVAAARSRAFRCRRCEQICDAASRCVRAALAPQPHLPLRARRAARDPSARAKASSCPIRIRRRCRASRRRASENETSFTGRTQPARVGNSTVSPRTSSTGLHTNMIVTRVERRNMKFSGCAFA